MRGASVGLALVGLAAAATQAAEVHKQKIVVKGHEDVRVRGYVSLTDTCESRGPVEVYLDEAPKGGTICTRQGNVPLENLWYPSRKKRHCLGKWIGGVWVIYVPHAGFIGNDAARYTVKNHDAVTRTYEVEIRVEWFSKTTSSPSQPQKPGPMPVCPAALVS
jgi:hypothetical protein